MKTFSTLILFFVLLTSCTTDNREAAVKEYIKNRVSNESAGALNLASLTKTDGKEMEMNGVKLYELMYKAVVEVTSECWKSGNNIEGYWQSYSVLKNKPKEGWDSYLAGDLKHLIQGDQVEISGKATLEKRESGWHCLKDQYSSVKQLSNSNFSKPGVEKFIAQWKSNSQDIPMIQILKLDDGLNVSFMKYMGNGNFTGGAIPGWKLENENTLVNEKSNEKISLIPEENSILYNGTKYVFEHKLESK